MNTIIEVNTKTSDLNGGTQLPEVDILIFDIIGMPITFEASFDIWIEHT